MNKSYIWPLVNRISHVMLMIFLAVSYTFGNYKSLFGLHVGFGIALGVVFSFRAIWGFVGPKYSKFKDFDFSFNNLKEYMLSVLSYVLGNSKKDKEYIGHNPASSFAIVTMIVLTFLSIISGLLAQGIEKGHGIFAYMYSESLKSIELFSGAHSFFANLLIWVIVAHISGSLIDKYIKKSDAIDSMITGYKQTMQKISVKLNIFQKIFAIVWILVSLYATYYLVFTKNIFII